MSNAGLKKGFDRNANTRSGMLWQVERLLDESKEKPSCLLMENVQQVLSEGENFNNFNDWCLKLESLGYTNYYFVQNAKDVGYPEPIPQNRVRCFMVSVLGDYNYQKPKPSELKLRLKDLLEPSVDESFYLTEQQMVYITDFNRVCDNTKRGDLGDRIVNPQVAKTISCRGAAEQRADITNFQIEDHDEEMTIEDVREIMRGGQLVVRNATKQGYLLAEDGDGVDISSRMESHRGTVQKGTSLTLKTQMDVGVVVDDNEGET